VSSLLLLPLLHGVIAAADAGAGALKSAAKGSPEYVEASTVTGLADKYLLSWSYWMFKPFHDITTQAVDAEGNVLEGLYDKNGNLQRDKVFVLTRTYARAVAGTFISQSFDLETAAFSVTYNAAASAPQMQSEIYLSPDYHYPLGYHVSFSPSDCCTWAMASKFVMLIRYPCECVLVPPFKASAGTNRVSSHQCLLLSPLSQRSKFIIPRVCFGLHVLLKAHASSQRLQ
jgi:hypothetical protein